jgi:hypothetical protein
VAPIFCHLPPPLYLYIVVVVLCCSVLFSFFFPISLSVFYFRKGAGKCFVLCCDVYHCLVGVASYVGINLLSLLNNTYWWYFVSLQQSCLVLCSWIWLHWPPSVVSPGKTLMTNQRV